MINKKIDILNENSKFYKLDFGINETENLDDIYSLILLGTLSGFSCIDVSANEEIIKIANSAIKEAKKKSFELDIGMNQKTLLFASFGINKITNLDDNIIFEKFKFLKDFDIDGIDIHFNEIDFLSNIKKIDLIFNFFKEKIISVNISRKRLSNIQLVELLTICFDHKKKDLIVEVEGIKSYKNNLSHILQMISTADIINKQFKQKSLKYKKVPLILGDCKEREIEILASQCNVPFKGISFDYLNMKDSLKTNFIFSNNEESKLIINEIKIKYKL